MNLIHLTHKGCPSCDARVIGEQQHRQHTNGQWFEVQEFECGSSIQFIPNYGKEKITNPCPESPEEKEAEAKRKKAMDKLYKYVNKLDVDEDFKDRITRYW